MAKVFLGGTVNGAKWRDLMMPKLKIEFFNPVVDDWTEEAYKQELYEREHCDYCLYVLTPKLTGYYSVAEVVDDSNKRPEKTIFCVIYDDEGAEFTKHQKKSLTAIGKMVQENGAKWFDKIEDVIDFLNTHI